MNFKFVQGYKEMELAITENENYLMCRTEKGDTHTHKV